MQFVIADASASLPKIGPQGIGTGHPALTPLQNLDCIPRVGEEIAFLANDGSTRRLVVVQIVYAASESAGVMGCWALVEVKGP